MPEDNRIISYNGIDQIATAIKGYIDTNIPTDEDIKTAALSNILSLTVGNLLLSQSNISASSDNKEIQISLDTNNSKITLSTNTGIETSIGPVRAPTSPSEVANKQYVDSLIGNLSPTNDVIEIPLVITNDHGNMTGIDAGTLYQNYLQNKKIRFNITQTLSDDRTYNIVVFLNNVINTQNYSTGEPILQFSTTYSYYSYYDQTDKIITKELLLIYQLGSSSFNYYLKTILEVQI